MSSFEENAAVIRPDAIAVMERLRPLAAQLESARQEALAKHSRAMGIAACIAILVWLASFAVMLGGNEKTVIGIICGVIGTFIALVVYSLTGGKAKRQYLTRFKNELFVEAIAMANPGIKYQPGSMVPKAAFQHGGLFNSRIDRYQGEDAFRGTIGSTELLFSELHVQRKETSTDSKGRTRTRWVTVFKGIYLIADFHKDFTCRVEIQPDFAESSFGWLGRKLQGISGDLVRLENPDFEKAFKVTSTDALGARYLLTPDMQERFLDLRNKWSSDIRAALLDSSLHLALPNSGNWFEPDFKTPADDLSSLHALLMRMDDVLQITEILDLNTRIWTKQ